MENDEDSKLIIEFISEIKSIKEWIKSLESNEERDKAIQYVYDSFILLKSDPEYNSRLDAEIQEFSREKDAALKALNGLILCVRVILGLKLITQANKKAIAELYLKAVEPAYLYQITPANYRRSTKGWLPYAKSILLHAMLTEAEFSKPLILPPADLHRIIASTYRDRVSLQSVAQFMKSTGYTKPKPRGCTKDHQDPQAPPCSH